MKMQKTSEMEELREENEELRKTLSICLNEPLVKDLAEAMRRIEHGEYVTEDEFFKDSQEIVA